MDRTREALVACPLVVFGHTLGEFIEKDTVRNLDVVELWAGVGSVEKAARKQGLQARSVEKEGSLDDTSDLLTESGFMSAIKLVLALHVGGLLWLAPVCSSFVWLTSSMACRSPANDFRGDQTHDFVQEGNLGADVAAFLFVLAWARGANSCLENPSGSRIWQYPSVKRCSTTISSCSEALINRCCFDQAPFGERYLKYFKVLATGAWIKAPSLIQKCRCPGRTHKLQVDRHGDAVRGRPQDLANSQKYPDLMGAAIIDAWLSRGTVVSEGSGSSGARLGVQTRRQAWCLGSGSSDDVEPSRAASTQQMRRSSSAIDGPRPVKRKWQVRETDSDCESPLPVVRCKVRKSWQRPASDDSS